MPPGIDLSARAPPDVGPATERKAKSARKRRSLARKDMFHANKRAAGAATSEPPHDARDGDDAGTAASAYAASA